MKKRRLFGRGTTPQEKPAIEPAPVTMPEKGFNEQDYKTLFIRKIEMTARSGKTVYISNEHHRRITQILQVIGKNEVSLFAFLHHVLEHHFETYREEITALHKKNIEHIY